MLRENPNTNQEKNLLETKLSRRKFLQNSLYGAIGITAAAAVPAQLYQSGLETDNQSLLDLHELRGRKLDYQVFDQKNITPEITGLLSVLSEHFNTTSMAVGSLDQGKIEEINKQFWQTLTEKHSALVKFFDDEKAVELNTVQYTAANYNHLVGYDLPKYLAGKGILMVPSFQPSYDDQNDRIKSSVILAGFAPIDSIDSYSLQWKGVDYKFSCLTVTGELKLNNQTVGTPGMFDAIPAEANYQTICLYRNNIIATLKNDICPDPLEYKQIESIYQKYLPDSKEPAKKNEFTDSKTTDQVGKAKFNYQKALEELDGVKCVDDVVYKTMQKLAFLRKNQPADLPAVFDGYQAHESWHILAKELFSDQTRPLSTSSASKYKDNYNNVLANEESAGLLSEFVNAQDKLEAFMHMNRSCFSDVPQDLCHDLAGTWVANRLVDVALADTKSQKPEFGLYLNSKISGVNERWQIFYQLPDLLDRPEILERIAARVLADFRFDIQFAGRDLTKHNQLGESLKPVNDHMVSYLGVGGLLLGAGYWLIKKYGERRVQNAVVTKKNGGLKPNGRQRSTKKGKKK